MADEIYTNLIPNTKAHDNGDGTFSVGVNGEFSIDQTTPGTTNGVVEASAADIKTAVESLDTKTGEVQATPTEYTLLRRLKDLLTGIVLAASTNVIGLVRLVTASGNEVTDDTLNAVKTVVQVAAMAGQTPAGVNVTSASGVVLAANTDRTGAILVNDSDTVLYLAIGQTAVANQGIRLNAHGGSLVINKASGIFSTEAINGIHGSTGNKVCTVQEFE